MRRLAVLVLLVAACAPTGHTADPPKRIQLRRTKGWRKPDGAVVVARPSKLGNPAQVALLADGQWAVTFGMWDAPAFVATRREAHELAVDVYRDWCRLNAAQRGWASHDEFLAAVKALRGRDLACWCPLDLPCHADVLLELANRGGQPCDG